MSLFMKNIFKSVAFVALMIASVPALFAHAHPKTMSPAADSTGAAPQTISITFSEAVEAKFSSIQLTDEKGKSFSKETSKSDAADPKTVTLAVPALPAGVYIVHWVNVSVDGHRMAGEYKFTVQ